MTLESLIAPTVEPLEPPISIIAIIQIITNDGQVLMTSNPTTLAPVVVAADTTVNNNSIG